MSLMTRITANAARAIRRSILPDVLYRTLERYRGLSYPSKLIGRRNIPISDSSRVKILAFAAHPDDEVLGLGVTLTRHRANGDEVAVVFTTNGAYRSWRDNNLEQELYAKERFNEACSALSIIRIPPNNIINLGFPDAGLRRFIPEAAQDIEFLIQRFQPEIIYVHALEGGHRDHDVTSFLVQHICARLSIRNVYEWSEYNTVTPLGQHASINRFPDDPYVNQFRCLKTSSTEAEYKIRQEMLGKYASQAYLIEQYPVNYELLREAQPVHLIERLRYFTNLTHNRLRHLRVFDLAEV